MGAGIVVPMYRRSDGIEVLVSASRGHWWRVYMPDGSALPGVDEFVTPQAAIGAVDAALPLVSEDADLLARLRGGSVHDRDVCKLIAGFMCAELRERHGVTVRVQDLLPPLEGLSRALQDGRLLRRAWEILRPISGE